MIALACRECLAESTAHWPPGSFRILLDDSHCQKQDSCGLNTGSERAFQDPNGSIKPNGFQSSPSEFESWLDCHNVSRQWTGKHTISRKTIWPEVGIQLGKPLLLQNGIQPAESFGNMITQAFPSHCRALVLLNPLGTPGTPQEDLRSPVRCGKKNMQFTKWAPERHCSLRGHSVAREPWLRDWKDLLTLHIWVDILSLYMDHRKDFHMFLFLHENLV